MNGSHKRLRKPAWTKPGDGRQEATDFSVISKNLLFSNFQSWNANSSANSSSFKGCLQSSLSVRELDINERASTAMSHISPAKISCVGRALA
ncbi:Uncharacterized protein HZ326_12789 [Fusarium oxysporum f. sp. albedinis]|nr:Uncharacterized protein HZ326_12789 [Fusarium oxysporum f. sp. albedinis]